MAMAPISAVELDLGLLAQLRAAIPEQIGDDLVLRLPDGRVYYIDGFFALDETGDGLKPEPDAIELAADVAALLLGDADIDTAAGPDTEVAPPPDASRFESFAPDEPALAARTLPALPDETAGDADDATNDRPVGTGYSGDFLRIGFGGEGGTSSSSGSLLNRAGIGTISLAAGQNSAPTWSGPFDIRRLFALEELVEPAAAGWFDGLSKAKPLTAPIDITTFALKFYASGEGVREALPSDYDSYLQLHDDVASYADGRSIWANLTPAGGVFGTRDNSLTAGLPQGMLPADVFQAGDFIVGSEFGVDRLHGYAGDDILIGYGGENHLHGGEGDDLLIAVQGSYPLVIDGGDGVDTFMLVIHNPAFPFFGKDLGTNTSIERLILLPQDSAQPTFLNEDFDSGRITPGLIVFDIDAATILAWGGSLTIDCDTAAIRLADIEGWVRLPTDPADPLHVHYRSESGGQIVSLKVLASADQPIADAVVGTGENDNFYLGDRIFALFDGAAGDDQIQGGLLGGPIGQLDLADPSTLPFRNIESIQLVAPTDQVILSAAAVGQMTDSRNTLWVTSHSFGSGALFSDGLATGTALGQVSLVDAALWTALGYLSVETSGPPFVETRMGAIYGSAVGGGNVYLFVQLGMEQPLVDAVSNADHWLVAHGGAVNLPPNGTVLDLDLVEMDNGLANLIMFDMASLLAIAGPDRSLSIIGDAGIDIVEFADVVNWRLSRVEGEFTIYQGIDQGGQEVELRISSALAQPYLLPDAGVEGLDILDMTNGHANLLKLDVAAAAEIAGPDGKLTLYGDWLGDTVAFSDPEHWTLTGRDANFLIFQGADPAGNQVELSVHMDVASPNLFPRASDGDDVLNVYQLWIAEQNGVIDGKGGFDVLHLLDAGSISPRLGSFMHIEAIDLLNDLDNVLAIHASTLAENGIGGPLFITGDAGDSVTLEQSAILGTPFEWTDTGTAITNSALSANFFTVYQAVAHTSGGDVVVQLAVDQAMLQPILP